MSELSDTTTAQLIETARATMSTSYNPKPVILAGGRGVRVQDRDGREYLDMLAGIAVNALGHGHPALVEALKSALDRGLLNISNGFFNEAQILLQEKLIEVSFADRVFFSNSGAEANEAAIKLARRYQSVAKKSPRFEVITFDKSFHGRTYGALTATAQPKYHAGFGPMLPGFVYAKYNDLDSVRAVVGAHTAAIMVEPIQGEAGVRPATKEFLQGLRQICDENGVLLIFDEVQTGVARTGAWFAYERFDVVPDIMSLAKGLGGGLPIGAMLATDEVYRGFQYGSHATTFGGNPMSSAAALAVLQTIEREELIARVREAEAHFDAVATAFCATHDAATGVRGMGLLKGLVVELPVEKLVELELACMDEGLLLKATGGEVLRFVPALTVTNAELDEAFERLGRAWSRTVK